jgi:hypothetical protein
MVMLSITLFFVLMFTSTAFYCGNNPYNTRSQQCMCENLSCCTPESYPNLCCQNSTLPLPFLGEWILADTSDPDNTINAELPLIISYQPEVPYAVQIPWLHVPGGPQTLTYNFTIVQSCQFYNFESSTTNPYGRTIWLFSNPPYLNISLSYQSATASSVVYTAYFVPVNQTKFDLIS